MTQGSTAALSTFTGSGPQYAVSACLNLSCTASSAGVDRIDTTLADGIARNSFLASFFVIDPTHRTPTDAPLLTVCRSHSEAVESDFTHCGISMFETREASSPAYALALLGGVDASRQGAPTHRNATPSRSRALCQFSKSLGVTAKLPLQGLARRFCQSFVSVRRLKILVAQGLVSLAKVHPDHFTHSVLVAGSSGRPVSGASST